MPTSWSRPLIRRCCGLPGTGLFPWIESLPRSWRTSFTAPLEEYSTIFVLNVARLPEQVWGRLNRYLRNGGGLVVGLGDRVDLDAWNQQAASLLPGTLGEIDDQSKGFFTFGEADLTHPLFASNTQELLAELGRVPVYRYVTVQAEHRSADAPGLSERRARASGAFVSGNEARPRAVLDHRRSPDGLAIPGPSERRPGPTSRCHGRLVVLLSDKPDGALPGGQGRQTAELRGG